MKTYEIYNLTTGELLADNLSFEDMPELYGAYLDFYPNDNIIVCCREVKFTVTCARIANREPSRRRKFYGEWLNFMDEMYAIGNLDGGSVAL